MSITAQKSSFDRSGSVALFKKLQTAGCASKVATLALFTLWLCNASAEAQDDSRRKSILLLRSNQRAEHLLSSDGQPANDVRTQSVLPTTEPNPSRLAEPAYAPSAPLLDLDYYSPHGVASVPFDTEPEQTPLAVDEIESPDDANPLCKLIEPPSLAPTAVQELQAPDSFDREQMNTQQPPVERAVAAATYTWQAEPPGLPARHGENGIVVGQTVGITAIVTMLLFLLILLSVVVIMLVRLLPSKRDQLIRLQLDGLPPLWLAQAASAMPAAPMTRQSAAEVHVAKVPPRKTSVVDLESQADLLSGISVTFHDLWKTRESELRQEEQAIIEGLTEENVTMVKQFAGLSC